MGTNWIFDPYGEYPVLDALFGPPPVTQPANIAATVHETVVTINSANSAATINLALGNVFRVLGPTPGGTCTLTLTGATPGVSCGCTVFFYQPASGGTSLVTFTASGGGTVVPTNDGTLTAPTQVAGGIAIYVLTTSDGGVTWFASKAGDSASTTTPTVPGAPTIGTATPGNTTATVAFTAPASNGGSAITGYTATTTPGSHTGTGSASPISISGLTNGTAYTATVHATNAVGSSAESAASNSFTPTSGPTAPGPPTIGTSTAGNAQATANWTAGSNGGSTITGYTVTTFRASDNSVLDTSTVGVVLTFTQTGLTNGTAVYFEVAAINAIGTGSESAASNTVTPAAPGASDNFNRANSTTLGTSSGGEVWTEVPATGFQVQSNQAINTIAGDSLAYLDAGISDFTVTVDTVMNSLGEVGIAFRIQDTSNYWRALLFGGNCYLQRVVAGTPTNQGGIPGAPSGGAQSLKVVCSGSSISVFVNSGSGYTAFQSITDSTFQTATKVGLHTGVAAGDTTSTYDNFLVA